MLQISFKYHPISTKLALRYHFGGFLKGGGGFFFFVGGLGRLNANFGKGGISLTVEGEIS
jgi:hypothetical protein